MGWDPASPNQPFIFASLGDWYEYRRKRREIRQLRRAGAHDAELAYLERELQRWVRGLPAVFPGYLIPFSNSP